MIGGDIGGMILAVMHNVLQASVVEFGHLGQLIYSTVHWNRSPSRRIEERIFFFRDRALVDQK